ncbi:hypothetical protein HDU67_010056 [Dinochytrium kinnereticum]|nr:hypothetical protein HDU67_010056 [Dinochytrium kinnereticum]
MNSRMLLPFLASFCVSVLSSPNGGAPREPQPEVNSTLSVRPTAPMTSQSLSVPIPSSSTAAGNGNGASNNGNSADNGEGKTLDQLAMICLGVSAGIIVLFLTLLCAFRIYKSRREKKEIDSRPEWFDRRPCLGTLQSQHSTQHSTLNNRTDSDPTDPDVPSFMTSKRSIHSPSASTSGSLHSFSRSRVGTLEKEGSASVILATSPLSSCYSMPANFPSTPTSSAIDAYMFPSSIMASPHILTSNMGGMMPVSPIYQFPRSEQTHTGVHPDWNLAWMQYYEQQYHQSLMYHHLVRGSMPRDNHYMYDNPTAAQLATADELAANSSPAPIQEAP